MGNYVEDSKINKIRPGKTNQREGGALGKALFVAIVRREAWERGQG